MSQATRRKKGDKIPEPPPRREIGTYDLKDYPHGELVDTGDNSVRRAWQISERVLIVIGGEKHAADAGDFVYELRLPGGAPGALEVLQADVAQGMGYEWKEGRESSSPFPAAGTTAPAGTTEAPTGTKDSPAGPPPDGTYDVYLAGPAGGYLSSITTTPELGKVIHLAGRGSFTVAEIEGQDVYVTPGEQTLSEPTGSAAAIALDLIDNAPPEERRIGSERRVNIVDVIDDNRTAQEDRRASANLEERRDPDLPNGRRDRDPELVDPAYKGEEKRGDDPGRRAGDGLELEHELTQGYSTSDELTDMGPGAVAILESLVRWAKRQTKPWRDLSEKAQERELADLDRVITERVRELVVDVAAREFPYVHATLEKVEFSEGIKATITIPAHSEHRHELADHAKDTVTIVLAGAATWTAGTRPRPDKDQPQLL